MATFVPVAQAVRRAIAEHAGVAAAAVVPVRQLPKTTSGKLQRFALADAFQRGDFAMAMSRTRGARGGGW